MLQIIFSFLFMISVFPSNPSLTEMEREDLENVAFRDIEVSGEKGHYIVTGEGKLENGEFFYIVEDGHNEIISLSSYKMKKEASSQWSKFRLDIQIPKEKQPTNGTIILFMYERDHEGKMKNGLPITLENIEQADT